MGDTIEISTWPKHQHLFYLVTGSAFSFDIKAPANATVGLARKPGSCCDYWVGIGENNQSCWIKGEDQDANIINSPNILTQICYSKFWLTWYGGIIRLGRSGVTYPIVTYKNRLPDLKYITFASLKEANVVHWRFTLPPLLPRIQDKPISGGKMTWIAAGDQLPEEAVIGGFDHEALYVIRAPHRGSLTPGNFVPSEGRAYVPWGGEANMKMEFEVLCGFDCAWVPTFGDQIPVGAIVGGYSQGTFERLYIGRAQHEGLIIPGKVQPSHKVCYIAYKGQEVAKKRYEILVEPGIQRSVNKVFKSDVYKAALEQNEQGWRPRQYMDDDDDDEDDDDMIGYGSNDELNEVMAL